MNDFIELEVDGASIPILRVLNEEDDQERNDRGGGIHDEMPGVGEMKVGAGKSPEENNQDSDSEGPFRANEQRGATGERVKASITMAMLGDAGAGDEIPGCH